MCNIKTSIDNILQERERSSSTEINKIEKELEDVLVLCNKVSELSDTPLWEKVLGEERKETWDSLKSKAGAFQEKMQEFGIGKNADNDGAFAIAKSRASRKYVNIGIVAAYRQGKSTFLKKIINYNNDSVMKWLIPTSGNDNYPCTGTKINYVNDVYQGDNNIVYIELYEEKDIIESIKSLLKQATNDNIRKTLDGKVLYEQAINGGIKELIDYIKQCVGDGFENETHDVKSAEAALVGYLHIDDYMSVINENKNKKTFTIPINNESELQTFYNYVCFWPNPDSTNNLERKYACLAVKEATVYKKFQIDGVDPGKIQFLDTPGIGEVRTSVRETLTDVLKKHIDITIAIQRIVSGKDAESAEFMSYLKKELNKEYIIEDKTYSFKDCLYYVLNDDIGYDKNEVESNGKKIWDRYYRLIGKLKTKDDNIMPLLIEDSHIHIIDCNTNQYYVWEKIEHDNGNWIKCTPDNNVQQNGCSFFIIKKVLEALQSEIGKIDKYFFAEAINETKQTGPDSINDLKESIHAYACSLNLKEITKNAERDGKRKNLSENINNCKLSYSNNSEKKFKEFSGKTAKKIVEEYLNTPEAEAIKKDQHGDFKDFYAFKHYNRQKIGLIKYLLEQINKCFDTAGLDCSAKGYVNGIEEVFKTILGDIDNNKYPGIKWLDRLLQYCSANNLSNIDKLLRAIRDEKILSEGMKHEIQSKYIECFNAEKPFGEDKNSPMWKTEEQFCFVYNRWLEDIVSALLKAAKGEVLGVPSFNEILQEQKEKYEQRCREFRSSINSEGCAYSELGDIIDGLGAFTYKDIEEKNKLIREWQQLLIK